MKNIITYKKITTEYDNICYVNSIFALFLYLYINKGDSNTLFVSHSDFETTLKESKLSNVIIVNTKLNGKWDSLKYKFGALRYDINQFIDGKLFFGHDHLTYAFLFNLQGGTVLEDGLGNYGGPIAPKQQFRRWIKGRVRSPLGYGDAITSIYLSKPEQIDTALKDKAKVFQMPKMLDYTRNHSLSLILPVKLESLSHKNILFTQPISDLVGEEGKIQLYREIIEKYSISVLKPHPRETTDYTTYFQCEVLDKFIPAEALISPDDVDINLYTLSSTSVLNLKEVNSNINVDLLAMNLHEYLAEWQKTNKEN